MLMEQGRIHHAGPAEDFERLEDQLCAITEDSDRSRAHDDRADAYVYAITELRGLSGGSWMGASSMIKCAECQHVYRDDKTKCPKCGLERDVFDPARQAEGPGRPVPGGRGPDGLGRRVRRAAPRCRLRTSGGPAAAAAGLTRLNPRYRTSWAGIWKRGSYR